MTAEEILKQKLDEFSQHNGSYNSYKHTDREYKDCILEAMEEYAQQKQDKWIKVENELPEIGVIVKFKLQHAKIDVYAGFRAKGGWYAFRIGEDCKQFIPNNIENVKIFEWQPLQQTKTSEQPINLKALYMR